MKVRIALFRWARWPDWAPIAATAEQEREKDPDYVQVSDYKEIEFEVLTADQIRERQRGTLEKKRARLIEDHKKDEKNYTEALADLDQRIAELASAPSDPPTEEERPAVI
jgi:hypothetical protein